MSAQVPPKVRIFAWRLSQNGLATQSNRKQRTLTKIATCEICGMGDEDGHHAVILCTKAMALRYEMRKFCLLPEEEQFKYTGPDWIILRLNSVEKEMRVRKFSCFFGELGILGTM
jgi:hypothetical protein